MLDPTSAATNADRADIASESAQHMRIHVPVPTHSTSSPRDKLRQHDAERTALT